MMFMVLDRRILSDSGGTLPTFFATRKKNIKKTIWTLTRAPLRAHFHPRMATLTETLLSLIDESELTIKEIAEHSEVPYQPLRRFVRGRRGAPAGRVNQSYDADSADRVYRFLAGKPFVEGGNQ